MNVKDFESPWKGGGGGEIRAEIDYILTGILYFNAQRPNTTPKVGKVLSLCHVPSQCTFYYPQVWLDMLARNSQGRETKVKITVKART